MRGDGSMQPLPAPTYDRVMGPELCIMRLDRVR